jgi:hypothetical protein
MPFHRGTTAQVYEERVDDEQTFTEKSNNFWWPLESTEKNRDPAVLTEM